MMASSHGSFIWYELVSPDPDASKAFFFAVVGWTNPHRLSMGTAGDYAFLHQGETVIGAVAPAPGEAPGGWTFYFRVPDAAEAADRVSAAGGTVRYGPQEVPGGNHVVGATDPHGIGFGLVGPDR